MKIKALRAFLGILSAVCVLYGAAVISIIGPGSWFNWAFVAIGVFAGAGAALLPRIGRLPAGVRTRLAAVLCACILIFAATEARIMSFAASDEAPGADWVVILGAKVDPWGPSLEYSARIRKAAEYLKNSPQSIAVTTGGQGVNEPVSEGRAAADMLQDLGIPVDRIIVEDRSTSGTKKFLCQESFYVHLRKSISASPETAHQRSTFFEREEVNKKRDSVWGPGFAPIVSECLESGVSAPGISVSCP